MSRDINSVTILGTVVRDARINPTKTGHVSNFSVVTVKKRGEFEIKKFHNVTCWNDLAEASSTLKEGDRVFVSGSIESDRFEKEGQTTYRDKITASAMERVAASVVSSQPQGGPPSSFSEGGGSKSTFPYADRAHKVSWPAPDESGFSYLNDNGVSLSVAWTDPTDPTQGGAVFEFVKNKWERCGDVGEVSIDKNSLPF
jgi:single stranded DNA-binding protein